MKNIFKSPVWMLAIAVLLYFVGLILSKREDVEPLKEMGVAEQEEYTRIDSEGDEHEGKTLVEIKGLGMILTYKDVYTSVVPMALFSCLFGYVLFGRKEGSKDLEYMVFGNCVLGALLIYLTTKGNIISTVLFWLGIVAAYIGINNEKKGDSE